jgi:hypothetical protein
LLIYIITKYPQCKYCHEKMNYAIIGLPYEEHSHVECEAKAMAKKAVEEAFNEP